MNELISNGEKEIWVSIICPVYNKGEYIAQGLDSILSQKTDYSYEILVGEDCSTDNSYEVLAKYEQKYPDIIHIYRRKKNLRQSRNVYDLFQKSRGKYVMILDLDDYWSSEYKLQKQITFLEEHPEYIGVVHDFDTVNKNCEIINEGQDSRTIKDYLGREIKLEDFLENGFIFQTATLCYRNIWREDWDYSILYTSDDTVVDLTINTMLLRRTPLFVLPESLSAYRLVIEDGAANIRSVCSKDLAADFEQSTRHLYALNRFFNYEVDFSKKWEHLLKAYLQGVLAGEDKRYKMSRFISMYNKADKRVKKRLKAEILGKIKRKFKR